MTVFDPNVILYISVAIVIFGIPFYHFFYWLFGVIPSVIDAIKRGLKRCVETHYMMEQLDDVRSQKAVADMNKCFLTMEEQVLKSRIKNRVANRGKQ